MTTNNDIGAAATARQYGSEGGGDGVLLPAAVSPPPVYYSPHRHKALPPAERARRYDALHAGRRAGLSVAEIARRLGVVAEEFRRWIARENENTERAKKAAKFQKRACLRCSKEFESEGAHNRMCGPCRGYAPVLDTPYQPDPGGSRGKQVRAVRS
jgi:hypothetical protein